MSETLGSCCEHDLGNPDASSVANGLPGHVELQIQSAPSTAAPAALNASNGEDLRDISPNPGKVGKKDLKFAILFVLYFTFASWVLIAVLIQRQCALVATTTHVVILTVQGLASILFLRSAIVQLDAMPWLSKMAGAYFLLSFLAEICWSAWHGMLCFFQWHHSWLSNAAFFAAQIMSGIAAGVIWYIFCLKANAIRPGMAGDSRRHCHGICCFAFISLGTSFLLSLAWMVPQMSDKIGVSATTYLTAVVAVTILCCVPYFFFIRKVVREMRTSQKAIWFTALGARTKHRLHVILASQLVGVIASALTFSLSLVLWFLAAALAWKHGVVIFFYLAMAVHHVCDVFCGLTLCGVLQFASKAGQLPRIAQRLPLLSEEFWPGGDADVVAQLVVVGVTIRDAEVLGAMVYGRPLHTNLSVEPQEVPVFDA